MAPPTPRTITSSGRKKTRSPAPLASAAVHLAFEALRAHLHAVVARARGRQQVGLADEVRHERRVRDRCRPRRACRSGRSTPWFITTMRSAMESASSWSWVTRMVVMPRRCCRLRISPRRRTRTRASSAESGSSSSSRPGEVAMARAIAMRCCWPPESCAGILGAAVGQADQREQLLHARLALRRAACAVHEPVGHVLARSTGWETARTTGRRCRSRASSAAGARCPCPAWITVPEVCTSSPATMRSSVVLPQPEGPRKQMSSPGCTARLTPFSATKLPNSLRMSRSSRNSAHFVGSSPRSASAIRRGSCRGSSRRTRSRS